jgi:hypothetical protein
MIEFFTGTIMFCEHYYIIQMNSRLCLGERDEDCISGPSLPPHIL